MRLWLVKHFEKFVENYQLYLRKVRWDVSTLDSAISCLFKIETNLGFAEYYKWMDSAIYTFRVCTEVADETFDCVTFHSPIFKPVDFTDTKLKFKPI